MPRSELFNEIYAEIEKIKIIDTHEHLTHQNGLMWAEDFDFGRLFLQYASSDIRSAGMPFESMAQISNPKSEWDIKTKWNALKPYYKKAWNTSYCRCLRIAIKDLYDIEDLNDDTVESLSVKMNAVSRDKWTHEVFDKANIEIALEQGAYRDLVFTRKPEPNLFVFDMFDMFSGLCVEQLSKDTNIDVSCLSDYLRIIDWYFEQFADKAGAFKISRAYDRILSFDETDSSRAESIFQLLLKDNKSLIAEERKALEDYIIHYCVRVAGEHELTMKFHTGLQEGNGNDIRNSRAAHLINLFMKYPKTRFDIYHLSWPYTEELINICKNFPNVFIDFCWSWIFNTSAAKRYLYDMFDALPINKIHGFGGDFILVEGTYGHSKIARHGICEVLTEKIENGDYNIEYALYAANMLLHDNAYENFRLAEKILL